MLRRISAGAAGGVGLAGLVSLLSLLSIASLAGCGSSAAASPTPTIPPGADAATTLQVEIAQQLSGQGLSVSDISCPPSVRPVVATTATCTGRVAGQSLNLSVTFEDDNQIVVTVVP